MAMTPHQFIMRLIGFMVLLGTALTVFVSQWAAFFLVFVGVNALQSTWTGVCPPTMFLRKVRHSLKKNLVSKLTIAAPPHTHPPHTPLAIRWVGFSPIRLE
jgi:uncharacterized membrane protein YfhO